MSDYIFYINESALAKGKTCFNEKKYQEAAAFFQDVLDQLYRYNGDQLYPMMLASEMKEKINLCQRYERDLKELNTHIGCVLYHLQRFDIEMVAELLDDKHTYQNLEKEVFIAELSFVMDLFKQAGDTYLNRVTGFCNSKNCHYKHAGYSLIGNHSGYYIDLIIDTQNGVIVDICQCHHFECEIMNFDRHHRIIMNDGDLPF